MTLTEWITRRNTPAPAPVQDTAPATGDIDTATMTAWGLTPAQWGAMDAPARVWHRWNITKAPGFKA